MTSSSVSLNAEQQQAADFVNGACLVTAVPGSGKTATLTQRIVNLIDQGVEARNICAVTFTNKAADEMKQRVRALNPAARRVWVSTFHRLCLRILRKWGDRVGLREGFSIYDEDDKKALLNRAHRMHVAATGQGDPKLSPQERNLLSSMIDDLRESALPFDLSTEDPRVQMYISDLVQANAVDFSGMLYLTWKILTKNEDISKRLSDRFKYVLVDEAQDTNDIQYAIAKILASHGNLFMVGDYQQSIFSWRGAKPENLLRFEEDFPGATVLTLPRNYRSKSEILEKAENVIWKNDDAKDVVLVPERGTGGAVNISSYEHEWAEARGICSEIAKLHSSGVRYADIAVIYRLNKLSQAVEVNLTRAGIPYRTRGGRSFFSRKEIKTTLSYMKLLVNPDDGEAFKNAVTNPKRGIGEVLVGKIENLAKSEGISVTEAAAKAKTKSRSARVMLDEFLNLIDRARAALKRGKGISNVTEKLAKESGYHAQLEKEAKEQKDGPKSALRLENIETFIDGIGEFEDTTTNPTIDGFLQQIALVQDGDKDKNADSVSLMTMHAAKGLEFPHVFIVGCMAGVVPHDLAVNEGRDGEERRLFYVAVTRAKDTLHISYPEVGKFRNQVIEYTYSPFLKDMFDRPEDK